MRIALTNSATSVVRECTDALQKLSLDTEQKADKTQRWIATQDIHFTQSSVSKTFSDGNLVSDLTAQLLNGKITPEKIDPIRVVSFRNKWLSLDNRRLRAFKDAFTDKIPVIICDLHDPTINREFHQKRTNKSTEGGVIRIAYSTQDSTQHFEEGAFQFTKQVLNWTFEQITGSLIKLPLKPLPLQHTDLESYYSSFLDLILEETSASLRAGLEAAENKEATSYPLSLTSLKKAKRAQNPSTLILTKKPDLLWPGKANDVFLLEYNEGSSHHPLRLLTVATYSPQEDSNRIPLKVVVEEDLLIIIPKAFREGAKWQAKLIGSLATHMRMYEVCVAKPRVPFLSELLTGELKSEPISQTFSEKEDLKNLNDSQKMAVIKAICSGPGIQLIQGPPGTGKTTTIISILNILSRKSRTLVCTPSNKAVHVLAERFVTEHPDIPVILAGVEDKLPEDNPKLQNIFLHTWGTSRLKDIRGMEQKLWDLAPIEVFTAEFQKTKTNLVTTVVKIQTIFNLFIELIEKLLKYNFRPISVDDLDRFKALCDLLSQKYSQISADEPALKKIVESKEKIDLEKTYEFRKVLSGLSGILTQISTFLQKLISDDTSRGLEGLLLNHSVIVFATLSVSGRKSLKEMKSVDTLIIDEAGQAVEAETLIPLMTSPKKCLLIGDTKQLPATVLSTKASNLGFDRSLLWRLLEDWKQPHSILTIQYRMHPKIRDWPAQRYYKSEIKDAKEITEEKWIIPALKEAPPFLAPYSFIHVKGSELIFGHSYINRNEADWVERLLIYFQTHYKINCILQVGVITFYKGQARLIEEKLKKRFDGIKVQTVDGFQGSENDIIIVSFVRANAAGKIGFLTDFRRLNVALTRAKHALILLGDATTLTLCEGDLGDLVKDAQSRKCFFDYLEVEKQLRPATKVVVPKHLQTPLCRFFNGKPGSCIKGKECDFSHSGEYKVTKPKVAKINKSNLPSAAGSGPTDPSKNSHKSCRFFNGKPGSCYKGDKCDFKHNFAGSPERFSR